MPKIKLSSCPDEHTDPLRAPVWATSPESAVKQFPSFVMMVFECGDGCIPYVEEVVATDTGTSDGEWKRFIVTTTKWGCKKTKDGEKTMKEIAEQIERSQH